MVYTSHLEEYLRLRQIFQLRSEQPNHHPGASAMQPPASEVGQPPLPSADWSPYDPSMNHASASLESNWTMQTQPPASAVGQRPVHSAGLSPYDPSMSHAFASLDPNWTTHTTMVHSPVDNQGNMQSSSTGEYRATEVGTEDHLDPGQTTIRIQSSTPSPSTQETSPPNQHDIEVAGVEATSVHHEPQERDSEGGLKCLWVGCTRRETFSSHASLWRHIRVQHVAYRSIRCPECGQTFGRVDNMKEHRGRRHRIFD